MQTYQEKLLQCVPASLRALSGNAFQEELGRKNAPVAVMFVDIEGCTRLCEDLPPAEMSRLIESCFSVFFEIIERAGGTVNEIMGDGFMAVFHQDPLERNIQAAASSAQQIRRQARSRNGDLPATDDPLSVNIGIHAGTALVGFTTFRTSSGERLHWTASGPVTNIAARLCALATGGTTLVSALVSAHLAPHGEILAPLGPQSLKNVSAPVITFRLDAESAND